MKKGRDAFSDRLLDIHAQRDCSGNGNSGGGRCVPHMHILFQLQGEPQPAKFWQKFTLVTTYDNGNPTGHHLPKIRACCRDQVGEHITMVGMNKALEHMSMRGRFRPHVGNRLIPVFDQPPSTSLTSRCSCP